MSHIVVVGDALLDIDVDGVVDRVCPDAPAPVVDLKAERPRPGGAALAAVLAAGAGDRVTLVAGIGSDEAGERLRALLAGAGIDVVDLGLRTPTPVKQRIRAAGQVLVRLDRGAPTGPDDLGNAPLDVIGDAAAVVVADYGRGVADLRAVRGAIGRAAAERPVVWDPHPRGAGPVPGAWLVTPNQREAELLAPGGDTGAPSSLAGAVAAADALVQRWSVRGVAVTRGSSGAVLSTGTGTPLAIGAPVASVGDPCGAGDRFAAAAGGALAAGAVLSEAVIAAVEAASAFVDAGGAGAVDASAGSTCSSRPEPKRRARGYGPGTGGPGADGPGTEGVEGLVADVRGRGGTVVATGGCFDLVHAGHVELLQRARSLGDCLVVCLNSDRSVRRLKGPGRPIVPAVDRARVLQALAAVDGVVVFDDDTPVPSLDRLRPDVFVKGGDYAAMALPEQAVLARWGGVAVTIPYVGGRSTSQLVEEVVRGR